MLVTAGRIGRLGTARRLLNGVSVPTIALGSAVALPEGNSGQTVFTFTITRSTTAGSVTIPWTFAPGNTSPDDFVGGAYPASGSVTIANGSTSGTIAIGVAGDLTVEPDEIFTIGITAPNGYVAGGSMSATGTIVNDDGGTPPVTPVEPGRIAPQTLYRNTIAIPTPQAQIDSEVAQRNDPTLHYEYGKPYTHTLLQPADPSVPVRWGDPASWNTGTVPGITPGQIDIVNAPIIGTLLFDIVCPLDGGIEFLHTGYRCWYKVDRTKYTRRVIYSAVFHGPMVGGQYGESIPWRTDNADFHMHDIEFFCPPGELPGATAKCGDMYMGPHRYDGTKPLHRFELIGPIPNGQTEANTLPIGSTSFTVPDGLIWDLPIGADVTIGATNDPVPNATSDPTNTGPTQVWAADGDQYNQKFADSFRIASQSEDVTVTAVNVVNGKTVVTFTPALQYNHRTVISGVLPGTNETIYQGVPIVTFSKSIRIKSRHTDIPRRAHLMSMHHDWQCRGVEFVDMGRTAVDPSLDRVPYPGHAPGEFLTRKTENGEILNNPNNVRGRYVWHGHMNGPLFSKLMGALTDCCSKVSPGAPPTPGWVFVSHGDRQAMERTSVRDFRGSAHQWERGNEIGHAHEPTAIRGRGNGYQIYPGSMHEVFEGHNDGGGVAAGMQARQIVLSNLWAIDCNYVTTYLQQAVNIRAGRTPYYHALEAPTPITKGGRVRGPIGGFYDLAAYEAESTAAGADYGIVQAQKGLNTGMTIWCCGTGEIIGHRRYHRREDPAIGVTRHARISGIDVFSNQINYSWNYSYGDIAARGVGTFAALAQPQSRQCFSNIDIHGSQGITDYGAIINYGGGWVNVNFNGLPMNNGGGIFYFNAGTNVSALNGNGIYGPYQVLTSTSARAREWKSKTRAEALVDPYPAVYGPGGSDPDPGAPRPDLWVDAANSSLVVDWNGGMGQLVVNGIIRDNMGLDRLGSWQNPETFPSNLHNADQHELGQFMTPLDYLQRNLCYDINGTTAKIPLHYRLPDRGAQGDEAPFFVKTVVATIINCPNEILQQYACDPEITKPLARPKLEQPPYSPIVIDQTVYGFRMGTAHTAYNGELRLRIYLDNGYARPSLGSGGDSALGQIKLIDGVYYLIWKNDVERGFEAPADANGDNVYEFPLIATNPYTGVASAPFNIAVTMAQSLTPTTSRYTAEAMAVGSTPSTWDVVGAAMTVTDVAPVSGRKSFIKSGAGNTTVRDARPSAPTRGCYSRISFRYTGNQGPDSAGPAVGIQADNSGGYLAVMDFANGLRTVIYNGFNNTIINGGGTPAPAGVIVGVTVWAELTGTGEFRSWVGDESARPDAPTASFYFPNGGYPGFYNNRDGVGIVEFDDWQTGFDTPVVPPTPPVEEAFTRQDTAESVNGWGAATSGQSWLGDGIVQIVGNQGRFGPSSPAYPNKYFDVGSTNFDARVTGSTTTSNGRARLQASLASNAALIYETNGTVFYFDGDLTPPVKVLVEGQAFPVGPFDMRMVRVGNNVTAYRNGIEIFNGSPDVTMKTGTMVGVSDTATGGTARFTSFKAKVV